MLRSKETMLGKFKVIDCFLLIYSFPSWTLRTSKLGCMFFGGTDKSVIISGEPQVLMFHGKKWMCLWLIWKAVSQWVHAYVLVISFNIILVLFWRCSKLHWLWFTESLGDVFQEDRSNSVTIGIADDHIGLVVGRGGRNIMEISQVYK